MSDILTQTRARYEAIWEREKRTEFNSNPSPAYLDAKTALERLEEREPGFSFYAFADVWTVAALKGFRNRTRATVRKSHPCLWRLAGQPCQAGKYAAEPARCMPFGNTLLDHATMWYRGRDPYAIVAHPYDLPPRDLLALEEFCKEHSLLFTLSPGLSWHFPGMTFFLEITRGREFVAPADEDTYDVA